MTIYAPPSIDPRSWTLLSDIDREADEACRRDLESALLPEERVYLLGESPGGTINRVTFGPTCWRFINCDDAEVLVLYGPRRESKTTAGISRLLRLAQTYPKVRPIRAAIVRDTHMNLKRTVVQNIYEGVARGWWDADFRDQETECWLNGNEVHVLLMGMERPADATRFQGLGLGVVIIEEPAPAADMTSGVPVEVFAMAVTSLSQPGIPPSVMLITNPPDEDHWVVQLVDKLIDRADPKMRVKTFWVPPGENRHVRQAYRDRMRIGLEVANRGDLVRRLAEGKLGSVKVGEPVTPEFNEERHVAKEALEVRRNFPTFRSFDLWHSPCCCPADAMVTMANGTMRPIADVKLGDEVASLHGDPVALLYKATVAEVRATGWKRCVTIETKHHRIRVSDDHPMLLVESLRRTFQQRGERGSRFRRLIFKSAGDIRRGDEIAVLSHLPTPEVPYVLPTIAWKTEGRGANQGARLSCADVTPAMAELFGAWLGDGSFARNRSGDPVGIQLAAYHEKVASRWARLAEEVTGKPPGRYDAGGMVTINHTELARRMVAAGLRGGSREKRIPSWVFSLPIPQRLSFLRGYLDSDGSVGKHAGRVRFGCVNAPLMWDLWALCRTLGIMTTAVRTKRRSPFGDVSTFTSQDAMWSLIGSTKWQERLRPAMVSRKRSHITPGVVSERVMHVTYGIIDEPVWDLQVEPSHTFIVNGAVTHNCIWAQQSPLGYLHILGCIQGENMGVEELIATHIIPWERQYGLTAPRFADPFSGGPLTSGTRARPIRTIIDPSGKAGDQSSTERSAAKVIEKMLGTTCEYGPVAWSARRDAVKALLARSIRGRAQVSIDPEALPLIRALRGGWRYPKTSSGQIGRLPIKDMSSHPGDSLGYLAAVLYPVEEQVRAAIRTPAPTVMEHVIRARSFMGV